MPNKLTIHAEAVNLARRYSIQNENDLMQENLFEDAVPASPTKKFDHDSCLELSKHLLHPSGLPKECKKYQDVVSFLKRRDSDTTHGSQILS